jgi:predicted GIY-YIG superfamily endonuclease
MDTDAKKIERFCDGLDGKLYEQLNLLELGSFHELVNKAISQEDAMKKAHRDKKGCLVLLRVAELARSFAS